MLLHQRILLIHVLTTGLDGGGWQRNQDAAEQDITTCPDHYG